MQPVSSKRDGAHKVLSNARALLIIQVANQLLPFLLVPYLTRTLGVDIYGVVAFGLALVQVACIVTDYGFNLSVTLNISQRRDDVTHVNRVIGAVYLSKTVLLFFVMLAVIAFALLNSKYAAHSTFLLVLCLPLVAQTFLPVWFFQGIEKMAYITVFTVISRIAYVLMVFAFVSDASDYVWLAIVNGVSQLLAVGLALMLMLKEGYRPAWPGVRYAIDVTRKSTEFFLSRAAVSTYTAGGAVFLGLVSTPLQVGYYAAAEQLYRGAQSLFAPLSQALYPNMARTRNFTLLFRISRWATAICIFGVAFGVIFGKWIIVLLFGPAFSPTYTVLLVLLVTLAVNTPSVLLGYPLLGALGQARVANLSVLIAGVIQLVLLAICFASGLTQAFHVALTVLIVETIVLILRIYWGRREHYAWQRTTQLDGV